MRKSIFWKVCLGLLWSLGLAAAEVQVGSLSEGSCWYEYGEALKVASFNEGTTYSAEKNEIDSELENLLSVTDSQKIIDNSSILHCGGYGASLVSKITTEARTYCLWSKFEKGHLALRSIGVMEKNSHTLCDGRKWGEFIVGISSKELMSELNSDKWSSMIKSIVTINDTVLKVVVTKEYEFREQVVIDTLQENFTEKSKIRYIEFNDFRHPIGEYVQLK